MDAGLKGEKGCNPKQKINLPYREEKSSKRYRLSYFLPKAVSCYTCSVLSLVKRTERTSFSTGKRRNGKTCVPGCLWVGSNKTSGLVAGVP